MKILLIEDNIQQANLISQFLRRNNHEVINAYNGKEALRIVKTVSPDYIIVDYVIPDINGLDVLRFMKSNKKTSNIPVLMISANEMDVKCNFLRKPFKFSELKTMIEIKYKII